jgi:aspartate kinase
VIIITEKKQDLIIMKFGGSCLQDGQSFTQTTEIVRNYLEKSKLIIVASAMKGVTDELINFYKQSCNENLENETCLNNINNIHNILIKHLFKPGSIEYEKSMSFLRKNYDELTQLGQVIQLIRPSIDIQDLIMSYGEKLCTFILAQYLNSMEMKSEYISSGEIIITDDNFGSALPILNDTEILVKEKLEPILNLAQSPVLCITGFYGSTKEDKKTTTFGRGGTDLSAAIIAYSLRNSFDCKVIYWKDVKGFLDADPRVSEKTSLLKQISYVEAKELAFFGTKVLHPLCLDVNEKGDIPSEVRSFNDPYSDEYTRITKEIVKQEKGIKAITSIYELSMVTIVGDTMIPLPGTASKLFSLLGDNNIDLVFISQSSSENNITFGINFDDSKKVSFLLRNSELFGKSWFRIMINNELNFTAIIERKNCKKAINVLYDAFIG